MLKLLESSNSNTKHSTSSQSDTSNEETEPGDESDTNDEANAIQSDSSSCEESNNECNTFDEEEQLHLTAIEKAIKDRGLLDHTLVHGVFVGPPWSGKDSLMKRLLGEKPSSGTLPSTGVAENVICVRVEKSSTTVAACETSKFNWERLTCDKAAIHLMITTSNRATNNVDPGESLIDKETVASSSVTVEDSPKTIHKTQDETSKSSNSSIQSLPSPSVPLLEEDSEILQVVKHDDDPLQTREHKSPLQVFKEAIKNEGFKGLTKQLAQSLSLYLTNTGGQMEFQELLPLLVSGPSMFFVTFQLHKDLHQHFSVEYRVPGGKSSKSYQSSFSIMETILQTLSSIAAMGTFVYKGLQKKAIRLRPKVFIIGTHKDLLDKSSAAAEIKKIDMCLQGAIKPTSHYTEGIIHFASESQMIFTVNNLDPDDSDFHRIRSSVNQVVENGEYRMKSPAHWLIYSLVMQQLKNRVETYDECFAIAKECGISDKEEFNEALHFIHMKMGLVRYFPHKELKDLIIDDPQILFEKVTELIVETFTFENVRNHSSLEMYKHMGIFSLEEFTSINSKPGENLTPSLFTKLLEHLRIAA